MDKIETIIKRLKDWIENPIDYRFDLNLKDDSLDCLFFDTDREIYDKCMDEIGFVKQIIPMSDKVLIVFQSIYTYDGYVEIPYDVIDCIVDW